MNAITAAEIGTRCVLVVEDEETLRDGIGAALADQGYQVSKAPDGERALEAVRDEVFDVVITDLNLPRSSGIEVLKRAKAQNQATEVLVMTAYGTIESAVLAMKEGAFDYLLKPFALEELEMKVERALAHRRLLARLEAYDREEPCEPASFVACSPQMQQLQKTIEKVARSNATVLIVGETGVGKERIAEAIHRGSSRAGGALVKLNCGALHEGLLESELFGHERGAFTGADRQRSGRFELANEGTLFLDEIGNMSSATQAKVLRVLQERELERLGGCRTIKVDVRLVAATNCDLEQAISRGEFREDLYYRLNVVKLRVPPLRERKEDIVPLAEHFIRKYAADLRKDVRGLEPGAVRALKRSMWPGNIRELQNAIERAVLMSEARYLTAEDVGPVREEPVPGNETDPPPMGIRLPAQGIKLEDVEKLTILEALRLNNWIQKDAARFLGISSRAMNYKVSKYGITGPRWSRNRETP